MKALKLLLVLVAATAGGSLAYLALLPAVNIDFGVWKPQESSQTGAAAVGKEGDYWNVVGVPWNDNHSTENLKTTQKSDSGISVHLKNLGGGWGNEGKMGMKHPMYESYNYPAGNKGGNSEVVLTNVPTGIYDLYLYGHHILPGGYGDYTVTVGTRDYGRKATANGMNAITDTQWIEGSQYVKFALIQVRPDEEIRIFIQPGAVGQGHSDTIINGLQLIPSLYTGFGYYHYR